MTLSCVQFNWPEKNCCACGATSVNSPPPPPEGDGTTAHGYALHLGSYCRGADRTFKKESVEECEAHCASRKCACSHFGKGVCRFTYSYVGLLRSNEGFRAFVRPGASSSPAALKAAAAEAAVAAAAVAAPKANPMAACGAPPPSRVPPTFYMYDGPEFMWGERRQPLLCC